MTGDGLRRWGGLAFVAVAAALVTTTDGSVGPDSTWILQVAARMEAGDVLYRDVFAGVPPLAFLVARAATRLFGLELLVLRAVLVAVIALSYLVAADLLRRATRTDRYSVTLAGMMALWALPAITSLYQPLANLCLLAGLDAVAWWDDRQRQGGAGGALPLWLAGSAAGLSFLAKHTVGACALLAVGTAVAGRRGGRRRVTASTAGDLAAAGAAFGLTVAVGLWPIAVTGGWQQFLDYAFLSKGTYLSVAAVPYAGEIREYLALLRPEAFERLAFVQRQPTVLPLLLVPALAVVLLMRRRLASGAGLVVALALAEAASLVPRADIEHIVPAVPGMLVTLLVAWRLAAPTLAAAWRRSMGAACVLALAASLLVRLGASASALVSDRRVWSDVPHLRGVLMYRERAAQLHDQARALGGAAPAERLFLLSPDASLFYLAAGLENPTPFDYPLVTAFGRTGEADLVARLADGRIGAVCMRAVEGPMAPARLQEAVRTMLSAGPDLGACTLYVRR